MQSCSFAHINLYQAQPVSLSTWRKLKACKKYCTTEALHWGEKRPEEKHCTTKQETLLTLIWILDHIFYSYSSNWDILTHEWSLLVKIVWAPPRNATQFMPCDNKMDFNFKVRKNIWPISCFYWSPLQFILCQLGVFEKLVLQNSNRQKLTQYVICEIRVFYSFGICIEK